MIWWAYAGLSGAVVFSIVLTALTIGAPTGAIVQLSVWSASVMLGLAMLANILATATRRRRPPDPTLRARR